MVAQWLALTAPGFKVGMSLQCKVSKFSQCFEQVSPRALVSPTTGKTRHVNATTTLTTTYVRISYLNTNVQRYELSFLLIVYQFNLPRQRVLRQ